MPVLYHVPILHTAEEQVQAVSPERRAKAAKELSNISAGADVYWRHLTPSLLKQLEADGLLDQEGNCIRPLHLFMDAMCVEGDAFLQRAIDKRLFEKSPTIALIVRLCQAGAKLHKTEDPRLVRLALKIVKRMLRGGDQRVSCDRFVKIGGWRDEYIIDRISSVLAADKESVGVLFMGAAHSLVGLEGVSVRLFHRADILPKSFWEEFASAMESSPIMCTDDFGHIPEVPT